MAAGGTGERRDASHSANCTLGVGYAPPTARGAPNLLHGALSSLYGVRLVSYLIRSVTRRVSLGLNEIAMPIARARDGRASETDRPEHQRARTTPQLGATQ
jgi:hypothetical protein